MASLDWKKLGIYAVVAGAIAAGFAVYHQPNRPPHPVVIVKPEPTPPPPPVVEEPKPKPPVVVQPKLKQPVRPKSKSRFTPRPVNTSPGCRDVPHEAYRHPLNVVVNAARRMGVPEDRIDVLVRCWKGERVN